MLGGMPHQQRKPSTESVASTPRRAKRCTALTTSGSRCNRQAVTGLTVCRSHGGGTASSVRASKRASVSSAASKLWGISSDTGGVSVKEQLDKLAQNKMTDIVALRTLLSEEGYELHIGNLKSGSVTAVYDIQGTVNNKSGTQRTTTRTAGTSPFVQELHKAEMELVQILRLLHEVTDVNNDPGDVKRIRIQAAREAARLAIGFPGMNADEIAMEVAKRV